MTFNETQIAKILKACATDEEIQNLDYLMCSKYDLKSLESTRKEISDKRDNVLNKTFNIEYKQTSHGKRTENSLTLYESMLIIFLMLYKSGNNSVMSKLKLGKYVANSELFELFTNLYEYLHCSTFNYDGNIYKMICDLKGVEGYRIEIPDARDFAYTVQIIMLKNQRTALAAKLHEATDEILEAIVPSEIVRSIYPTRSSELEIGIEKFCEENNYSESDLQNENIYAEFERFFENTPYFHCIPSKIFENCDIQSAISYVSLFYNRVPLEFYQDIADSYREYTTNYFKYIYQRGILPIKFAEMFSFENMLHEIDNKFPRYTFDFDTDND